MNTSERFLPLVTAQRTSSFLSPEMIRASLVAVGDWLDAASGSTGETRLCHRTALYHDSGEVEWLFPTATLRNSSPPGSIWPKRSVMIAIGNEPSPMRIAM